MRTLLAAGLLSALVMRAATLAVGTEKELTLSVPDATAAYVVDSEFADVMVDRGILLVRGKYRGATHVVVITATGSTTYELTVFESPHEDAKATRYSRPERSETDGGSIESDFDSRGRRLFNALELFGKSRDVETRLLVSTITYAYSEGDPFALSIPSRFVFSGLSFDIRSPGRRLTLFDQAMKESPLTVYNGSVRGFHMEEHGFFVHVGYTSPSMFNDVFLPTLREGVFGGGYRYSLDSQSSLTFSLYRFTAPPTVAGGQQVNMQPGTVLSTQYAWRPNANLHLTAEIGYSRSVGGSAELVYTRPGETLNARFRFTPENFAALTTNRFPGITSDASWDRRWSRRWRSSVYYVANRYIAPGIATTNASGGGNLRFEADVHWALTGGLSVSRSSSQNAPPVNGINLPLGLEFHSRHFSAGMDYQRTQQTNLNEGGQMVRPSISANAGPVQVSAYAMRQTQAPTLQFVLTQAPGLQEALLALGLTAVTPQQIAEFLQNNAALISQGLLQSLDISLTPRRQQAGGSISWHSPRRRTSLSYDFLYYGDQSISATSETSIHRLAYLVRITPVAELQLSWSGYDAKPSTGPRFNSMWSVALRRQLGHSPAFMLREHRGTISGQVFSDPENSGRHSPDSAGVAGVEVILDGERHDRTGPNRFTFSAVPEGKHQVLAQLKSGTGYFSTPGMVLTDENTEVYFGVGRMMGTVLGTVKNDAGKGVGQVTITLRRGGVSTIQVTTGAEGEFMVSRLEYGDYVAAIAPETLPPGYAMQETMSANTDVTPAGPGHVAFEVTALRSVGGLVEILNRQTGKRTPAPGLEIRIRELSRTTKTDQRGRYLFRNLSSGTFTVVVSDGTLTKEQTVKVLQDPVQINNLNLTLEGK
jgi:hypothetical protein